MTPPHPSGKFERINKLVFFLNGSCGREGSEPRNEVHRSSPRKGKGPFKHQSKPDIWAESKEVRLKDNANSGKMCEQRSNDGMRTDHLSEEPEEP